MKLFTTIFLFVFSINVLAAGVGMQEEPAACSFSSLAGQKRGRIQASEAEILNDDMTPDVEEVTLARSNIAALGDKISITFKAQPNEPWRFSNRNPMTMAEARADALRKIQAILSAPLDSSYDHDKEAFVLEVNHILSCAIEDDDAEAFSIYMNGIQTSPWFPLDQIDKKPIVKEDQPISVAPLYDLSYLGQRNALRIIQHYLDRNTIPTGENVSNGMIHAIFSNAAYAGKGDIVKYLLETRLFANAILSKGLMYGVLGRHEGLIDTILNLSVPVPSLIEEGVRAIKIGLNDIGKRILAKAGISNPDDLWNKAIKMTSRGMRRTTGLVFKVECPDMYEAACIWKGSELHIGWFTNGLNYYATNGLLSRSILFIEKILQQTVSIDNKAFWEVALNFYKRTNQEYLIELYEKYEAIVGEAGVTLDILSTVARASLKIAKETKNSVKRLAYYKKAADLHNKWIERLGSIDVVPIGILIDAAYANLQTAEQMIDKNEKAACYKKSADFYNKWLERQRNIDTVPNNVLALAAHVNFRTAQRMTDQDEQSAYCKKTADLYNKWIERQRNIDAIPTYILESAALTNLRTAQETLDQNEQCAYFKKSADHYNKWIEKQGNIDTVSNNTLENAAAANLRVAP